MSTRPVNPVFHCRTFAHPLGLPLGGGAVLDVVLAFRWTCVLYSGDSACYRRSALRFSSGCRSKLPLLEPGPNNRLRFFTSLDENCRRPQDLSSAVALYCHLESDLSMSLRTLRQRTQRKPSGVSPWAFVLGGAGFVRVSPTLDLFTYHHLLKVDLPVP